MLCGRMMTPPVPGGEWEWGESTGEISLDELWCCGSWREEGEELLSRGLFPID